MASGHKFQETLTKEPMPIGSDRSFGLLFAVVFGVIAAWPLIDGQAPRIWSVAVVAAFLVCALLVPRLLRPLNVAWMAFGRILHAIMTPVIMGLLFFVFVTPMAWLMRLFGKTSLQFGFDPLARSYWINRTPPGPTPETMKNQF